MPGKILAAILLILGGGITMYVLYKVALGLLQPVVQKKLSQKMHKQKLEQLHNNLQLHNQDDQDKVSTIQKNTKR